MATERLGAYLFGVDVTKRESIEQWYNGYDPIFGAIQVAAKCTELTPGDCLRAGLLPLGWDTGCSVRGVVNEVKISDRDPERIERAQQFIMEWDSENH